MRVLNEADVRALLPMADCIEAMARMFVEIARGGWHNPLRSRTRPEGSANWMTLMPVLRTGGRRLWGLKEMAVSPDNPARGLDPIQGAVLLHDGEDGRLLGIVHAPALTALRTAAVSALATRTLARAGAATVAVIGAGVQGRMHIEAMRSVLPGARIRLWGRSPDKGRALAAQAGAEFVPSIETAIRGADVVCTVTAALEPVVRREWFGPGCHLNAVGSSTPAARELDGATLAAAALFVDRREAALAESGDVLGALKEGAITPDHIRAELGEVLAGLRPGRRDAGEFTLYKSLGFAAQDLAAAELALERAARAGRGTEIAW
jgi:ornithine cyclodeaminase